MKKSVFCVLLALLVSFFVLATADSALFSALAETIPLEYPQSFDYTQELTRGNFSITIPSSFSLEQESTHDLFGHMTTFHDPLTTLYITISYDDSQPRYRNAGELVDAYLGEVRRLSTSSFELARADECMALIVSDDWPHSSVSLYIYNMDERLRITAVHGMSADDTSELAPLRALIDGILEHIVAPEQTLE